VIRESSWLGTLLGKVPWSVNVVQVRRFDVRRMHPRLLGNGAISATAHAIYACQSDVVIVESPAHRDFAKEAI
jgi:hypothetical protein